MKSSYLPSDGSITIIDDNIEEAIPFFNLLSQNGIPFTYYTGNPKHIPVIASQKIRLVFLDIQLVPGLNEHAYAQNILQILSKLISIDNGPYIAIIWSKREHLYFKTIQDELLNQSYPLRPISILKLKKRNYITEVEENDAIAHFQDYERELSTRFDAKDINYFQKTIIETFPKRKSYKVTSNAISKIERLLEKELKKTGVFNFFTSWEKTIYASTQKTLSSITRIFDYDNYWQNNTKHLLYSMAHAIVGKKIKNLSKTEILQNCVTLLNQAFTESNNSEFRINDRIKKEIDISSRNNFCEFLVNTHVIKISHTNFEKFSLHYDGEVKTGNKPQISELHKLVQKDEEKTNIKEAVKLFRKKNPLINTNLHLNLNPESSIIPASVFSRNIYGEKKRNYLKNYFNEKDLFKKNENIFSISIKDLKEIKFVELEVTPICDYAQAKFKKNRFISGILYPIEFQERCPLLDLKALYFYDVKPEFIINNIFYRMIFDFRFLKTIKLTQSNAIYKNPYFRIKNELYSDILSKLSAYINRPGVTFLE